MSSFSSLSLRCTIPVLALVMASCDFAAPAEPPQVTVRIIQSNVNGGTVTDVVELAAVTVPVREDVRRDSAFAQTFELPVADPPGLSFGGSCGGLIADFDGDILFWFVEENGSGDVVYSGVREFCRQSFRKGSRSSFKRAEVLDATLYAFTVDGIGGTSMNSLGLSIRGQRSGEEVTFEYEPERHRLSADHLLVHLDKDALGTFLSIEEASGLTIEVTTQGVDLKEHAFLFALAQPMPVYGTINDQPFEGTRVSWDGRSLSDRGRLSEATARSSRITYVLDAVPEELDFYLVALGEK